MYKRILLAYDGSVEDRTALREGALLARQCGAQVFLLSVLADPNVLVLAEVALAGASVRRPFSRPQPPESIVFQVAQS